MFTCMVSNWLFICPGYLGFFVCFVLSFCFLIWHCLWSFSLLVFSLIQAWLKHLEHDSAIQHNSSFLTLQSPDTQNRFMGRLTTGWRLYMSVLRESSLTQALPRVPESGMQLEPGRSGHKARISFLRSPWLQGWRSIRAWCNPCFPKSHQLEVELSMFYSAVKYELCFHSKNTGRSHELEINTLSSPAWRTHGRQSRWSRKALGIKSPITQHGRLQVRAPGKPQWTIMCG